MGLEAATYIDQLVDTNPTGTDDKNQGDNHLRLIKSVLQSTFPNLGTEALTPTAAELNGLIDDNRGVPTGMISMWSGTYATIPTGWSLCDGTGVTPDLRGKFMYGASSDGEIGDEGGATSHTHTGNTASHTHAVSRSGWGTTGTSLGSVGSGFLVVGSGNPETGEVLESLRGAGSSQTSGSASPSLNINSGSNVPPYYKLAYIMKD